MPYHTYFIKTNVYIFVRIYFCYYIYIVN